MIAFKLAATAFILLVVVVFLLNVIGDKINNTQLRLFSGLINLLVLITAGGFIAGAWLL